MSTHSLKPCTKNIASVYEKVGAESTLNWYPRTHTYMPVATSQGDLNSIFDLSRLLCLPSAQANKGNGSSSVQLDHWLINGGVFL